jgi:hypothetical protein
VPTSEAFIFALTVTNVLSVAKPIFNFISVNQISNQTLKTDQFVCHNHMFSFALVSLHHDSNGISLSLK